MMHRLFGVTLGLGGLVLVLTTGAAADPPRPGTTDSGLNESAEATLWSRQPAAAFVTNEAYRQAYGEDRTTIHEIANGTDVTFARPPATARRWTRYAHGTYEPGDRDRSVYPPHASLANGTFIEDAHATIFAVSPATTAHVEPDDTRRYVTPDGRLLGTVDYRIEVPPTVETSTREVRWRLVDHQITEVRLYADDDLIATGAGSHRPDLGYDLDAGTDSLRLEADVEATLERAEIERTSGGRRFDSEPRSRSRRTPTLVTDSVTVEDSLAVEVYDLRAVTSRVEYPDGDTGVMISQTHPWQGYSLTADGSQSVRGIWRFFTARETEWDELVHTTSDETQYVDSAVLPVYVHAYPSRLGPRAEPTYGGPTLVRTWAGGELRRSPAASLPANVSVEVVESAYRPTRGIAIRASHVDRSAITVHGIVHGSEARNVQFPGRPRHVHEADLSAQILAQNESGATVLLTLANERTGAPIVLDSERDGYIELAGERFGTNASGQAVTVLQDPGSYTARYEPASWLDVTPAYGSDSTVVRWHPLATLGGWLTLLSHGVMLLASLAACWYAGLRLRRFFNWGGG